MLAFGRTLIYVVEIEIWPHDMGRKLGAVPLLGGAATPSNTTSPEPMFTFVYQVAS